MTKRLNDRRLSDRVQLEIFTNIFLVAKEFFIFFVAVSLELAMMMFYA